MIEIQNIAIPDGIMEIRRQWCKGCNLCVNACPKHILTLDELQKVKVDNPEDCSKCGTCEGVCPDYAVRVVKNA